MGSGRVRNAHGRPPHAECAAAGRLGGLVGGTTKTLGQFALGFLLAAPTATGRALACAFTFLGGRPLQRLQSALDLDCFENGKILALAVFRILAQNNLFEINDCHRDLVAAELLEGMQPTRARNQPPIRPNNNWMQ
jgi:hypothetical protein